MRPSKAGDATHAIWQDPSSYDPYTHGPPYLPGTVRVVPKTASTGVFLNLSFDYPSLLVALRALAMIHQSHHWLTKGESFYADHLLFERLYNNVVEEIDRVGERAIGLGARVEMMAPQVQARQVADVVAQVCSDVTDLSQELILTSLKAEQWFLDFLGSVKAATAPSIGTDNLLGDLGDTHEEHGYLLQQRTKLSSADPWKAG